MQHLHYLMLRQLKKMPMMYIQSQLTIRQKLKIHTMLDLLI